MDFDAMQLFEDLGFREDGTITNQQLLGEQYSTLNLDDLDLINLIPESKPNVNSLMEATNQFAQDQGSSTDESNSPKLPQENSEIFTSVFKFAEIAEFAQNELSQWTDLTSDNATIVEEAQKEVFQDVQQVEAVASTSASYTHQFDANFEQASAQPQMIVINGDGQTYDLNNPHSSSLNTGVNFSSHQITNPGFTPQNQQQVVKLEFNPLQIRNVGGYDFQNLHQRENFDFSFQNPSQIESAFLNPSYYPQPQANVDFVSLNPSHIRSNSFNSPNPVQINNNGHIQQPITSFSFDSQNPNQIQGFGFNPPIQQATNFHNIGANQFGNFDVNPRNQIHTFNFGSAQNAVPIKFEIIGDVASIQNSIMEPKKNDEPNLDESYPNMLPVNENDQTVDFVQLVSASDASATNFDAESADKRKRQRTTITTHQKQILTDAYQQFQFPDPKQRIRLGLQTGLSPRQVQIWFQNTRRLEKQLGIFHNLKEERMRKKLTGN